MSGSETVPAAAYRVDGHLVDQDTFYRVACDPRRSVAVEACAGAGKTWMLVSRILRALLDGTEPQDILAITFTRKAAGEMRERLQGWLEDFAVRPLPDLARELQSRGMDAGEAQRRAPELQALHQRLLIQGRPVQIRTFHGWFAALLRSAPLAVLHELGLPAEHELLEDDVQALSLAWPRFYASVQADAALRQDFWDSVARHGRSQTLKALENALQRRVEFALADAEGLVDGAVQPAAALYPDLAGEEDEDPVRVLMHRHGEALLAAARALGQASARTFAECGVQLEMAVSHADADALVDALFTRKGEPRKFNDKLAGIELVRDAQERLARALAARRQHEAWLHQRRMARLTRVLLDAYAAVKRERGWVDMNDVEGAARRLLGDAELSGWLQQRLDARVRQLLVDEFQDTNPLQWQALCGWLSSYAGAGGADAPRVFLVGDPKQSIYRFRRAEPQVFRDAQRFVVEALGGSLLSCDHTRRCARGVVETLNAVMAQAARDDGYAGFRAHTTASGAPGEVLALPAIERPPRAGARDGEDQAAGEGEWRDSLSTPRLTPEDSLSAQEARQVADWIAAELAHGLAADEVMVLSRKRERLGWVHAALVERGIACEQPEKQDLAVHPVAQDVIALLDALVSPSHDLSLARALRSPIFGLGDAALARLARLARRASALREGVGGGAPATEPAWWDVLQALAAADPAASDDAPTDAALAQAARTLARWRDWLDERPPHDALSAIYRDGDLPARYAQAVPARQCADAQRALQAVLAQALAQDGGRFLSAYRFVRALKAGGITMAPTPGGCAVQLLTIHGAKGLEAHTVILIDADAPPPAAESMGVLVDWPGESPVPRRFVFLASERQPPACAQELLAREQHARALEELNALYVALTRAGRRLVVSSVEPHRRGEAPSWRQRIEPHARHASVVAPALPVTAAPGGTASVLDLPPWPGTEPRGAASVPDTGQADDDARTRIGLALHRLLQWVPTPAQGFTWQAVHERAVAREFHLTGEQLRQALAMARRVLQGEAAWAWDARVLAEWHSEVEIWHDGQLLRIDRLVRRADTGCWWVLDYKSALHPERHAMKREQLWRYHGALSQARPHGGVRLAFVNAEGRLIEIDAPAHADPT
jgi:ATP-dependent helicase/nuclease subunit A